MASFAMTKAIKWILSYIFKPLNRPYILIALYLKSNNAIVQSFICNKLQIKYFVTISKQANVNQGVSFPHPRNIMIGNGVSVGAGCIIYHDVTIGQNRGFYPQIGSDVIIYTGAKIIGKVQVGDHAVIGANAVVTKDVPKNAIVAGVPGRIVGYRNETDEFH